MLQFLAMSGRAGGAYCFVFGHPDSERPMEFFGKYVEATPHSRLVWTQGRPSIGSEEGPTSSIQSEMS